MLLFRGPRGDVLRRVARDVVVADDARKTPHGVRIVIDVDPQNLL
jgi:hypothetical protein